MKFVLKPSLEHMALVKIVVSLWNQNDVRALITKPRILCSSKWEKVENRVIKKLLHLPLPEILKEKVSGFIKPIGLQIQRWMEFHCTRFDLVAHLPAEFFLTPQGTLDRKKTAEALVKDEGLDISTRYELACIYCMEDDIIQFWNSMPENLKESDRDKFPTISFWSRSMRNRVRHNDYRTQFYHSASWGNKVAAEYFLQKIAPKERMESLVETAKYAEDADTLCFLISEMDKKQQIEFFRHNTYKVLKSLLQWPWQSFFMEITSCMWNFLSKNDYDNILTYILTKIADGYKDWNYQILFREFWQESPNALKILFIEEIDKSHVLTFLFDIKDKENMGLILEDAKLLVKEKNIYSDKLLNTLCECSICKNEWDFLKSCIQECFQSKNEMLKFKEEFEKRLMCPYFKKHFSTKKQLWDRLF